MYTAYTGWMWLKAYEDDSPAFRRQFRQCVKELAYLGYDYLENMTFVMDHFDDPEEIRHICAQHGVRMAGLYANVDEGEAQLKRDIDFIKAMGGEWMICAGSNWPEDVGMDSPIDREEIAREASLSNVVGAYARDKGVTFCFNHHSYTPVCRRDEIDYFASLTDPETVKFCLDCGHAVASGIDPVALIHDHKERLAYMHVKDIDPPKMDAGRGCFWAPLGLGTVNLPGVAKALREIGFGGIVCAGMPLGSEQICTFESARLSRGYLSIVFGC